MWLIGLALTAQVALAEGSAACEQWVDGAAAVAVGPTDDGVMWRCAILVGQSEFIPTLKPGTRRLLGQVQVQVESGPSGLVATIVESHIQPSRLGFDEQDGEVKGTRLVRVDAPHLAPFPLRVELPSGRVLPDVVELPAGTIPLFAGMRGTLFGVQAELAAVDGEQVRVWVGPPWVVQPTSVNSWPLMSILFVILAVFALGAGLLRAQGRWGRKA